MSLMGKVGVWPSAQTRRLLRDMSLSMKITYATRHRWTGVQVRIPRHLFPRHMITFPLPPLILSTGELSESWSRPAALRVQQIQTGLMSPFYH